MWKKLLEWLFGKQEESDMDFNIKGKKIALLVGINDYPGSNNDLRGCLNDADDWNALLKNKYGFSDIFVMKDKAATVTGVKDALTKIMKQTSAGCHIVFQYSGHGTQVADRDGDEPEGKDEALYLHNGTLIDDDLRKMLGTLPKGVRFTAIMDCCHSGTITRNPLEENDDSSYRKPRFLPPENPRLAMMLPDLKAKKRVFLPESGMSEMLITACTSSELASDASFGRRPNGAFTYYAMQVLGKTPDITYDQFMTSIQKAIPSSYNQKPQVEGSPENRSMKMFA